jgi:hypothetical protein
MAHCGSQSRRACGLHIQYQGRRSPDRSWGKQSHTQFGYWRNSLKMPYEERESGI